MIDLRRWITIQANKKLSYRLENTVSTSYFRFIILMLLIREFAFWVQLYGVRTIARTTTARATIARVSVLYTQAKYSQYRPTVSSAVLAMAVDFGCTERGQRTVIYLLRRGTSTMPLLMGQLGQSIQWKGGTVAYNCYFNAIIQLIN